MNLEKLKQYALLMRWHRPIGIYLILWPTLWALWLAAEGLPKPHLLIIFILGTGIMRSAGCVINDFADRHIDGHVRRTDTRPLVTGQVSHKEAVILFVVLCAIAFALVMMTNILTVKLSLGAVLLAFIYPFMKRHTHLPQVVLGAAFAWSIPMAFAAQSNSLDPRMWLVYTVVVVWTVTYDTFYAMCDREDDLKIGVKSTAVLLGDMDRAFTATLQVLVLFALVLTGRRFELGDFYNASLIVVAALFTYQQYLIRERKPALCFKAFLNNHWVGLTVFVGIVADYAFGAQGAGG